MAVPTLGTLKTGSSNSDSQETATGLNQLQRRVWIVYAILIIAFALRVVAAGNWHAAAIESGRLFRLGDSDSYWVLASHIARGEPYEYGSSDASIFRAPLYPLVLAPITLIADPAEGVWVARLLGCAAGTLSVWLVMQLANFLANLMQFQSPLKSRNLLHADLWAGVLAAIYPGAIGMSIMVLSEAIFCPLMLLILMGWCWLLGERAGRAVALVSVATGMASGLAILARPSWLLFMPLASLMILTLHPRRAVQARRIALIALGCASVMAPWWLRSAQLTHRWVPTTLQVGASLYDGLHPGASGGSDENMEFVREFIVEQRAADAAWESTREVTQASQALQDREDWQGAQESPAERHSPDSSTANQLTERSSFEYRLNARMQSAAVDWVRENVSGAFRLSLVKFARTWSLWPNAGEFGSTPMRLVLTLSCFSVLFCAAWVSWRYRKTSAGVIAMCWLPAVYFTLLHMVFVGSIRYREPAMLVLTALAGCALSRIPIFQRQTRKSLD